MKLPEISTRIKRLATLDMPVEALKVLFLDLAVELDLEEARLSLERERKFRGKTTEKAGNSADILRKALEMQHSRVEDNISKPSLLVEVSKKDSPPSPSKPLSSDPDGFAELWVIYPKRAGSVDRKAAVKAYGPALKRVDLKTLLAGARKYAAFCQSTGKVGTESVKQLRTWLNADGWTETYEGKTNDDFASTRDFLQRIGRA